MSIKLLTEHHLEFLSLKGDYTGSSDSTLVKMLQCWKYYVTAHIDIFCIVSIPHDINQEPWSFGRRE